MRGRVVDDEVEIVNRRPGTTRRPKRLVRNTSRMGSFSYLVHFCRKTAISKSVQAFNLVHFWRQIAISESVHAFILVHFCRKTAILESAHAFNLLHFWRKIAISESVQAHSWRQIVISESVQAFIFALKLNILVHIKHLVREEAEEWLNTLPTMISSWSWAVHSIFPTFCFHLHTKYSTPVTRGSRVMAPVFTDNFIPSLK